jgi:septum site-determining protein MinC
VSPESEVRQFLAVRGRSLMAIVLAPEQPLDSWLAALDAQVARSAAFFDGKPVLLDLVRLPPADREIRALLAALAARGITVIGTEGLSAALSEDTITIRPLRASGKSARPVALLEEPVRVVQPPTLPPASSLLLDQSVRSGQSIVAEQTDVTILGAVASGAEVIAGGFVHVYGALRGRAIAGLSGRADARIFCRQLDAELVAINGVYMTAEQMPREMRGRAAQIRLDGESILITPLDAQG